MRCEGVRPMLHDLADGSVAPTPAVRAHLDECRGCRADLATLGALLDGLGELRSVTADPPDAFVPRILASARRDRARAAFLRVPLDPSLRRRAVSVGAAAVGAVVVGAAAVTVLRRRRSDRRRPVGGRGSIVSGARAEGAAAPA